MKMSRKEWLALRRTGIGGSDSAAACGMSKWMTRLDLYLDKKGQRESAESEPMRWGTKLEPIVRQEYCDQTGRSVEVPDEILRHAKDTFAILTADGIADGERLYEGKTARTREGWGEPGTDEIPTEYLFQVQHGMYVTGLPVADVAVLFGGSDFQLYTVHADREFQAMMIDAERKFWELVQSGTPPEPESLADVKRRWPISTGRPVIASDLIRQACAELAAVKREAKIIGDKQSKLEAEIQKFMADAETLQYSGATLATWKNVNRSPQFDKDAFKEAHPELYKEFCVDPDPQRRFYLKSNGD